MTSNQTTKKYVARGRHLAEIEADMRERIASGQWKSGCMIPSRRELARAYSVDLHVIQRALAPLIVDGMLFGGVGKGTFVADELPPDCTSSMVALPKEPPFELGLPSRFQPLVNVGIVGSLWHTDSQFAGRDHNWPGSILHACECAIASSPNVTVKFRSSVRVYDEPASSSFGSRIVEMLDEGVDGLILIWPSAADVDFVRRNVDTTKVPVVIVRTGGVVEGMSCVLYDSGYAGFQAAEHLVQRGFENISFFNPYADEEWIVERRAGAEDALNKAGLQLGNVPENRSVKVLAEHSEQAQVAYDAGLEYLRNRRPSWGIIAANDHAAHGLLKAAPECGMRVGVDFGLIGFDDWLKSRELDLSSVHPPLYGMGQEGSRILLAQIAGERDSRVVHMRSHLVARASTLPLPQYGAKAIVAKG